jgi:hypothetical protein
MRFGRLNQITGNPVRIPVVEALDLFHTDIALERVKRAAQRTVELPRWLAVYSHNNLVSTCISLKSRQRVIIPRTRCREDHALKRFSNSFSAKAGLDEGTGNIKLTSLGCTSYLPKYRRV